MPGNKGRLKHPPLAKYSTYKVSTGSTVNLKDGNIFISLYLYQFMVE